MSLFGNHARSFILEIRLPAFLLQLFSLFRGSLIQMLHGTVWTALWRDPQHSWSFLAQQGPNVLTSCICFNVTSVQVSNAICTPDTKQFFTFRRQNRVRLTTNLHQTQPTLINQVLPGLTNQSFRMVSQKLNFLIAQHREVLIGGARTHCGTAAGGGFSGDGRRSFLDL